MAHDRVQAGLSRELEYWSRRRTLLKRFREAIKPYLGKTETTARLGPEVAKAAEAIRVHDASEAARLAKIDYSTPHTPEYRVRVPGARVLRIGTTGIDSAIEQAEARIEACDVASTYNYDRLIEIDAQIQALIDRKKEEQRDWPVEAKQAWLRWA